MTLLTDSQIQQLFDFCKSEGVSFYDVQVELVDHLAAAIEAQPEVPFDMALQKTVRGFGKKGFASVVETRRRQLNTQYRRLTWSLFIGYFNWPKVMLTLLLFTILYVLQYYCSFVVLKAVTVTAAVYLFLYDIYGLRYQYRYRQAAGKPLLMLKSFPFSLLMSAVLLNFYLNVLHGFRWLDGDRPFNLFTYKAFIIAYIIMLAAVLAMSDARKKLYQTARERYPEAFSG